MPDKDLLNPTPLDPADHLPAAKETTIKFPAVLQPAQGEKFYDTKPGLYRDRRQAVGYDPTKHSEYLSDVFTPTGGAEAMKEIQSRLQPWDDLAMRGLGRFASKTLTEIGKLPGYAVGGAAAIGTGDIRTMVDNAWVNFFEDVDESVKKSLPVYASPLLETGSLWDSITSGSFWATDFSDALGFLVSMFTPGIALKAIGTGGKIARGINAAKLMKLGKPASVIDRVKKGIPLGTADLKLLGKTGLVSADRIEEIAGISANTVFEAAAEAAGTVDNLKIQFAEKVKNGELTQAEADAKIEEAGTNVFLNNIALLIVPNTLSYKAVMGKFAPFRSMTGRMKGAAGQLVKEAPKLSTKAKAGRWLTAVGAGIVSEGVVEEGGQFAIEDYYNDKALGLTDKGYLEGIMDSYGEAWNTLEGKKAMFIGAVLGGGMGIISSVRESNAFKKNSNRLFKMLEKTNTDFAENLNSLYKTEVYTDAEGNQQMRYIMDEDTKQPVIDPLKVEEYLKNVADGKLTDLYMGIAAMTDNKDLYDTAFNDMLTKLVVPYASIEGGMDLLEGQLENISATMAKAMASEGVDISERASEIKAELMAKAEAVAKDVNFMDIYDNKYFRLSIPNKSYAEHRARFIRKLKNAVTVKSSEQRFHQEKMDENAEAIEELETAETVSELDKEKIKEYQIKIQEHEKIRDQRIQEIKDILNKKLQQGAFAAEVQLEEAKKEEVESQGTKKTAESSRLTGFLKELWDKNTFTEKVKFDDIEGTILHSSELNVAIPEDISLEDYLKDTSVKDAGAKMPPTFTMSKVTRNGNIELTSTNPKITQKAYLNSDGSFVFGEYKLDGVAVNISRDSAEMREAQKVEARLKSIYNEGVDGKKQGVIQILRDQLQRIEEGIGKKFEEIDILMKALERATSNASERAYVNLNGAKVSLTVKAIEERIVDIREGEKTIDPKTGEEVIIVKGIRQLRQEKRARTEEMEGYKQEYRKLKKGFLAKDPSVAFSQDPYWNFIETVEEEIVEWGKIIESTEEKIKAIEGVLANLKNLLKGAYTLYKNTLEALFPSGVPIENAQSIDEITKSEEFRDAIEATLFGEKMAGRKRHVEGLEGKVKATEEELADLNKKLLEYKSKLNRVNPATGQVIEGTFEKALRQKRQALKRFYREYMALAKGIIEEPIITPADLKLGKEDREEGSYDTAMKAAIEEEDNPPEAERETSPHPPFLSWMSFFRSASNQELAATDPTIATWFNWLESYDPATTDTKKKSTSMIYSYQLLPEGLAEEVTFYVRSRKMQMTKKEIEDLKEINKDEYNEVIKEIREEKELKIVIINKKSKEPVYHVDDNGKSRAVFATLPSGRVEDLYHFRDEEGKITYDRFSYDKFRKQETKRIQDATDNYEEIKEEGGERLEKFNKNTETAVKARLAKKQKEEGIEWLKWREQFFPEKAGEKVRSLEMGIAWKNPGAKQINPDDPWAPVVTRIIENPEDIVDLNTNAKIFVATKTSANIGGRTYPLKIGGLYAINQGRVEYLKPKTLKETGETDRILHLLRYYAHLDRTIEEATTEEQTATKELVKMLRESLGSILYFNYPKSKPKDFPFKMYMTPTNLIFGDNKISVDELVKEVDSPKIQELRKFLDTKYHHADVRSLSAKKAYTVYTVRDPKDLSKGIDQKVYEYQSKVTKDKKKKKAGYLDYLLLDEDDGTSSGTAKYETNVKAMGDANAPQYLNSSIELSENKDVVSPPIVSPKAKEAKKSKRAAINKNKNKYRKKQTRGTGPRGTKITVKEGEKTVTVEAEGEIDVPGALGAMQEVPYFEEQDEVPYFEDTGMEAQLTSRVPKDIKAAVRYELEHSPNTQKGKKNFINNVLNTADQHKFEATEEQLEEEWDKHWERQEGAEEQVEEEVIEEEVEEEEEVTTDEAAIAALMGVGLSKEEAIEQLEKAKEKGEDLQDLDRLVDLKKVERILDSKEIEWFMKKYPNFPIQRVAGLIGGKSYGRFKRNLTILLSDMATEGTLYHEAFHIVSQIFMTPAQRRAMYNEVRKRLKGKKVRTYNEEGTKYTEVEGENLTNRQAEEFLAEEFRSFALAEGNYTFPKAAVEQKGFFQTIWNFIKDFFNTLRGEKNEAPYTLEKIFQDIMEVPAYDIKDRKGESLVDLDRIARTPIITTNRQGKQIINTRKFDESYSLTLIKDFNYTFFNTLLEDSDTSKASKLIDFNAKSLKLLWGNTLLSYMGELATIERSSKETQQKYAGRKKLISDIVKNYKSITEEHVNFLKQYGVGIKGDIHTYDDMMEDPETEAARETRDNRGWTESNTVAAKAIMPPAVRLIIAGLALKTERTIEVVKDEITYLEDRLKNAKAPYTESIKNQISLLEQELKTIQGSVIDKKTGKEIYYSTYQAKLHNAKTPEAKEKVRTGHEIVTPERRFKPKTIGEYKAHSTVRYGTTINKLQEALIGLNEEEVTAKLEELSQKNPEFRDLATWLKLDAKPADLSKDESQLQTQFFNQFNMNKNLPLITLVTHEGNLLMIDAVNASTKKKLLSNWRSNIKSEDLENTLFVKDKNGQIIIDKNKRITLPSNRQRGVTIEELDLSLVTTRDTYALLKSLGFDIEVPFEEIDYSKLDGVDWIFSTIQKRLKNGHRISIDDIFTKEGLDVTGRVDKLLEYIASFDTDNIDLQYQSQDGKTTYSITLNSTLSNVVHRLNRIARRIKDIREDPNARVSTQQFLEEIDEVMLPFSDANPNGNLFSTNSDWMAKILDGKEIKLRLLTGMKEKTDSGIDTSNLSNSDFSAMSFNSIMNGNFTFLRAADRKLEYAFEIEDDVVDTTINENQFVEDFKRYLIDELLTVGGLVKFGIGKNLRNYRKNGQDLRFFKDILPDSFVDEYKAKVTSEEIEDLHLLEKATEKFIKQKRRVINTHLATYFTGAKERVKNKLLETRIIDQKDTNHFTSNGIDPDILTEFKLDPEKFTSSQLDKVLTVFTYNVLKSHIEQTKLFTGDPAMFKSIEEFHKRTTGAASTRQASRHSLPFELALRKLFKRADGKAYDGNARKVVYEDAEAEPEEYLDEAATEGDAQGRSTLDGHREILLRQGTWREQEETYQYEMQNFFLKLLAAGRTFNGEKVDPDKFVEMFGEHTNGEMPQLPGGKLGQYAPMYEGKTIDVAELTPIPPIKPQGFGNITGLSNLQATDFSKLSIAPIMLSNLNLGDPMFERVLNMMENQIDIGVFVSGEKATAYVDQQGELQQYYSEKGAPVPIDENLIQLQSFQDFGIQLEIDPLGKEKTRKATQQERLLFVDLFDLGKSSLDSQSSKDKVSELKGLRDTLSNEYVKREREKLIQKLGLEETKPGEFKLIDNDVKKFRDVLIEELTRRQMPTNVAEGLNLATKGKDKLLDTLITKDEIESVLMGLVRNRVIATKVNGYQAVQEASTGHEKGNRTWTTIKKKDGTTQKVLTSNYLKSYTKNEDGSISPMEVEIPLPKEWNTWVSALTYTQKGISYTGLDALNKMIEDKDKRIDEKLLLITGNRIPADGLHSLEAMKVKSFLPTHFGQKIILPTGIVIKAGSDFDIDKLTIYLPNFKITSKGPKYMSYSSAPLTKERVEEIYESRYGRLHKDFDKLEGLRVQAEIVAGLENREVTKLLSAIFTQDLDIIEEEIQENTIKLFKSKLELRGLEFKDYEKLTAEIGKIPTKKEFIAEYEGKNPVLLNGSKVIENKMIEIAQETILLPENYDQLLNPVSADTLKKISEDVRTEAKETPSYTALMEWSFNTEVARNNWEGIRGRALSAIATASHSLTQIAPITIEDPLVTIYLQGQERKQGPYKMGHVKDAAGNIISNNLGEFLSAYVDVAKDPFIRLLNMGDRVFPIYNFLQRFSNSNPADLETLMYLVTQPIIQDLMYQLEINSSIFLKAAGKNKSLEKIVEALFVKYSTEGTRGVPPADWMFSAYKDIQDAESERDREIAINYYVFAKRKSEETYKHLNKNQLKEAKDSLEEGTRSTEALNIQLQVLDNILLYDAFSKNLKNFQQVARPDASLGARRSSLRIRNYKISKLKEKGFFSKKDIENHFNNTYINQFNKTQESVIPMYSEFFFTDKYGKELGGFLQSMMDTYLSDKANMPERDLYKVAQNIENSLITFILHTQTSPIWKKNSKDISRSLNEFYEDILLSKKSPALQLKEIEKQIRILEKTTKGAESNLLFQRLIPEIKEFVVRRGRSRSLNNIKLLDVKPTTEELNSMTALFSELFESGDPKLENFATNLIKLQLIQSGMSSSVISFGKIVPEEHFQPIAKAIISKWVQERITDKKYNLSSFLENFRENFFKGAWNNPVVITRKHSKVMNREDYHTGYSYYDPNKMDIKIYKKDKAAAFDWIGVEGYSVKSAEVRRLQKEAKEAGRPYANIPSEVYLFRKVYNTDGSPKLVNRNRSYKYERVDKLGDGMYFTENYNNSDPFSILSYNKVTVLPKITKKKKSPAEITKAETERDKDPPVELDKGRRKKDSKKDMPSLFGPKETQSPVGQVVQERMRTFLKAIGVNIKEVTEIYDRRGKVLNASGLAKLSENIVEIIKNQRGLDKLPEEAAHFFVALLPKDSALKKAMFDNITNYDIYQETLDKYKEYYGDDVDALKEEAVGRLIAKMIVDIQNGDTKGMLESLTPRQRTQVNTWFNQLLRYIKSLFSKVNTDPFVKSAYKMLQADVTDLVPELSKEATEEFPAIMSVSKTVNEVFKLVPALSKIGTKEQYSQYFDTIFPKGEPEVYYHGSKSTKLEKFDKKKFLSGEGAMAYGIGFYFTPKFATAKSYQTIAHRKEALKEGEALLEMTFAEANERTAEEDHQLNKLLTRSQHAFDEIESQEIQEEIDALESRVARRYRDKQTKTYAVKLNAQNPMHWEEYHTKEELEKLNEYLEKKGIKPLDHFKKPVTWGRLYKALSLRSSFWGHRDWTFDVNLALNEVFGFDSIIHITQEDMSGVFEGMFYQQKKGEKQYVMFEPEQIHKIGSKKDLEDFTDFVQKPFMPSLDETFEEEKKEANDKYLKKAPYWFNGKQYSDNKTFSNALAQSVATKINQNYSTLDAKVVDMEEGEARIILYPKRRDMPALEEVELRKPEDKYERRNNTIVNVKEIKKVSTPDVTTAVEASEELMTNFEKYFPQYSYYTEEERKAFIKYMADGNIEIKCKL